MENKLVCIPAIIVPCYIKISVMMRYVIIYKGGLHCFFFIFRISTLTNNLKNQTDINERLRNDNDDAEKKIHSIEISNKELK